MALTPVVIPFGTIAPYDLQYLPLGTGAAQGFTFSLAQKFTPAKVVSIVGDADWFWSRSDGGTAATTGMVKVLAYQPLRIQVADAVSIYAKTASGTSNLAVVLEQ